MSKEQTPITMKDPKQEAEELRDKHIQEISKANGEGILKSVFTIRLAKQCAIICCGNKYHALREQLFNLRACGVIQNEKTYLKRLQELIVREEQVKQHL